MPVFALLLTVALLLTACFRDTSEAVQQPVAQEYATATVPPAQPEISPDSADETSGGAANASPATPAAEEPVQVAPSATSPDDEQPPTATATSSPSQAAEEQATIDTFALAATALIAQQTAESAPATVPPAATQQAEPAQPAIVIVQATLIPGTDCEHEIRSGETLFQLSLAYGSTVDAIAAASGIVNVDQIAVGQKIVIPGCGTTGFIPPPTSIPSPTIEPAAQAPQPSTESIDLASAEDTRRALVVQAQAKLLDNAAQENTSAPISAQQTANSDSYTVRQNDSLYDIALRFGTTVDVLATLNDLDDVNTLEVGQVLQLP